MMRTETSRTSSVSTRDSELNDNWCWEDQEQAVLSACFSLITVVDIHDSRIIQFPISLPRNSWLRSALLPSKQDFRIIIISTSNLRMRLYLAMKCPWDVVAIGGGFGTPLHAVLRGRHLKVLQLLLSHSIDIWGSDGQTPLHLALSDGLLKVTRMLHRIATMRPRYI